MLKVNVGLSRKLSRDFNSTGYSVNLEGEVAVPVDDPEGVIEKIREYYDLAEEALRDQVERYESESAIASRDEPAAVPVPEPPPRFESRPANGQARQNGGRQSYQNGGSRSNGSSAEEQPATNKQIQFLLNLGQRQGLSKPQIEGRIAEILGQRCGVYDLTKRQAGVVLDTLTEDATATRRNSRVWLTGSSHTVRGYIASVLAALNWVHEMNWLPAPPNFKKVKTSKKAMNGRPISEVEFRRMLASTPEVVGAVAAASWQFILTGLWNSALRMDELMHLSWDMPGTIRPIWVADKNPVLEIPASMQKNNKDQTIPLLPWFEAVLLTVEEERRTGWVYSPASVQLKLGRKVSHLRPEI